MRCRCDGATPEVWYDLKTTSDTTPLKTFWRSVLDYQYDLQAAIYEAAAQAAEWPEHSLHFIVTQNAPPHEHSLHFIVTQNAPPHACHVVTLPRAVTARATERALRLLEELRQRTEWNAWMPTDYGSVTELECPAFMRGEGNGWGE